MKTIALLNNTQRKFVFNETSFNMNVQPIVIEKDYWVCLILDFLFNYSSFKNCFIFKGGTSLSKCYHVIDRFSEDIDLILKWSTIGVDHETIFKNRSRSQNSKYGILLNSKCKEFIKAQFLPQFQKEINEYLGYSISIEIDDADDQTVKIYYPAIYSTEYIKPFIKLEIGPVSLQNPESICNVSPYCSEYFPRQFKYSTFNVPTISISRTFYEKILILSNENDRPTSSKFPQRYSRHYYDVCKMFNSDHFKAIYKDKYLFDEIKKFKDCFYRNGWSKYDKTYLESINIVPNLILKDCLKKDYESMSEMFFKSPPMFADILKTLNEIEYFFKTPRK